MALTPLDGTAITNAIVGDANYLRGVIMWAEQKYAIYNVLLTPTLMTAAGIATADQTAITQFINDLGRFLQLTNGVLPATAQNARTNIVQILGLQ